MPMLTTLRMRFPVWPFHAPPRTRLANSDIRSSTACACCHPSSPSKTLVASRGRPQRDVHEGPPLRNVELVPAEHGVDACTQSRALGELHEQLHGLVGDAVLGVVEVDPRGLQDQTLTAPWIRGEQLAQMQLA